MEHKKSDDQVEATAEEVLELLGSIPLLQQLPASSLTCVAEKLVQRSYVLGDYLVREGEPGEGLYIIWSGEVDVSFPTSNTVAVGRTLPILRKGDYFGYVCAGPEKELHKADVVAMNKVTCLVLPHEHANLIAADSTWALASNEEDLCPIEQILQLETLDVDIFRGKSYSYLIGVPQVFGGELVGQALAAATKSVDPKLLVHSLHSYFLLTGDPKEPIYYHVKRVRDGRSFATRRVNAKQKGQHIFHLEASFQRPDQDGFEHQLPMPDVRSPEQVLTWEANIDKYMGDPRIDPNRRRGLANKRTLQKPFDFRPFDPVDRVRPKRAEPREKIWLRARGKLSDDQALNRCVAAYASDFYFLQAAMRPHGVVLGRGVRPLSLDHAIWFHKSFKADEWLLFMMESPQASDSRGLVFGHMYTQSGELVISVAQEGMLRKIRNEAMMKSKL